MKCLIIAISLIFSLQTFAQDACTILAKHGVFEYKSVESEEILFKNTVKWLYESTISSHEELKNTGLTLGIPLPEIPISFGFKSSNYSYSAFRRKMASYLRKSEAHLSTKTYNATQANVDLAKIIASCKGASAFLVRDAGDNISLAFNFSPTRAGETEFTIREIRIHPANVAQLNNIPACSKRPSRNFPIQVDVGGCRVGVAWLDQTKPFSILINSDYAGMEGVLVVSPPVPIVPEEEYTNTFLKIQTQTGPKKKNGTDDIVTILVVGEEGQYITQRLNNRGINDFKKGTPSSFLILNENSDIGRVLAVEISIADGDDEGEDIDDWFIRSIALLDANRKIEYRGEPRTYIGDNGSAVRKIKFNVTDEGRLQVESTRP